MTNQLALEATKGGDFTITCQYFQLLNNMSKATERDKPTYLFTKVSSHRMSSEVNNRETSYLLS